mgnify:CR=1 FL=1
MNMTQSQLIIHKPVNVAKVEKEENKMKFKYLGIGAAGNKAVMELPKAGICEEDDIVLVNSTDRDIPKDFNGKVIIMSPENAGAGKERKVARNLAINYLKTHGDEFKELLNDVDSIMFITSVEGGTGSGSTPILTSYAGKVLGKNTHIVAFTGFEDDVRGLENTVEFFKEINFETDVMTIRNSAFLEESDNNKMEAEKLANVELVKRLRIMLGMDFNPGEHNIDSTDLYKLVSTTGYKTIEKIQLKKDLLNKDDFNVLCKNMIYNSKSVRSNNPGQLRLGMILNIKPETETAIDFNYPIIIDSYGKPYEIYLQEQYDPKQGQYIAFISSGMKMPIDEITAVYERYKAETKKVDKDNDTFFDKMKTYDIEEEDSMFNMVSHKKSTTSNDDFFNSL